MYMKVVKNKKFLFWVIGAIVVIAIGIGGGYYYVQQQWSNFYQEQSHISFTYPKIVVTQALSDEDNTNKIIFRGITEAEEKYPLLITVRYEENLRAIATFTHTDLLTTLMNNADRSLPGRFEGYNKISSRVITATGPHAAGEFIFSYKGPSGESITQRFMIMLKDDATAFYIAAQTPTSNFEKVNKKYFDKMFESVTFQ